MGLSIASKWIGIYAGAGLAILFFYSSIQHIRQHYAAKMLETDTGERRKAVARARYYGIHDTAVTWVLCVLFFIIIPLVIYYVSYIPYFNTTGGVTVEKVIQAAIGSDNGSGVRVGGMLGYHATPNLGMDHPFYSPWYEWPLILKPMYFASKNYVPAGYAYSIFCMGNPAVWWTGMAALLAIAFVWMKRHLYRDANKGRGVHIQAYDTQIAWGFLLIAFLSQYLPWVLVPRGTYIYHYFASLPFIMLATVGVFYILPAKSGKRNTIVLWGLIAVCTVCFIILYPYASGTMVPTAWLDFARKLMIKGNIYY
jgi:dolichyl-phosphate-mannose--protein O-mannosyl transferase